METLSNLMETSSTDDGISIPTVSPMCVSRANLVYAGRTTTCDIMSIINTVSTAKRRSPSTSPEKVGGSPFKATLPYKKSMAKLGAMLDADTPWTQLQLHKTQKARTARLLEERSVFMDELNKERSDEEWYRNRCATKIQATFRGFCSRPRSFEHQHMYRLHQRGRTQVRATPQEIRDELCSLAISLNLRVIPGLTLIPKSTESRRRHKISKAAALRIQRFFQMIVARNLAKARLEVRREEIRNMMSRRIVRFFKFLFVRSFTRKADKMKRDSKAVIIQCYARCFMARNRVRMLKRMKTVFRRENQASTIITRNYGPFVKRVVEAREKPIEELAELIVQNELFDLYFEDIVDNATTSESKVMYAEELAHEAVDQVFERLSFEVVDQIYDEEVELYIETQIRLLEELRLRLEAERLALEVERKRLEEEMERARKEEEERKRAEAQRIAIEVEERRRADKTRRDAEKEQRRKEEMRKKAEAAVVDVSELHTNGDASSPDELPPPSLTTSVDEYSESQPLSESFDDAELHQGTREERADRALSLKKYCRFELAASILSKLIKECSDEEDNFFYYAFMAGECYFELGQFSAAREQYARAIEKTQARGDNLQFAEVQIGLATVLLGQGLFEEALQAFDRACTIVNELEPSLDWTNAGPQESLARRLLVSVNVGLSELHRTTGKYPLAEKAVDAALDLVKDRFDDAEFEKRGAYAATLNAEARIYTAQGLLNDAIVAHNEALTLLVEFHATEQHPSVAATLNILGLLSLDMSKLEDAQHFIEKGLEIRRRFFDEDSLPIADSYFAWAKLLLFRGRYNEAQALMLKARDIRVDALEHGHHLHAQALDGLADIAIAQEQHGVAQQLYESALVIKRQSLQTTYGPLCEHWFVADSIHGLGLCKISMGRAQEALDLFEEAFRICKAQLSLLDVENHWALERSRVSIAAAHLQLGRLHEAHASLPGALKYLQAILGEVSLVVASGLLVLGKTCTALGRFSDAEEHLRHCAEVHDKVLGFDNLNLSSLDVHQAVGFNHLGLCRIDVALDACSLCLNIFCAIRDSRFVSEEALGVSIWRILHLRAQILREAEFLEDARVLYELALTKCRENYGDRSAAYVILLGDLADCLRRQRKFQLAEVAIEESLKLRKEVLGEGHYLVGELERSAALLLLDVDCPDLALARMESSVAAIMGTALDQGGISHPDLMFNRGIEGLCIRAKFSSSESTGQMRESVLRAQSLIDDALDYFDVYPQGKFSDLHPFILRLGGFGSTIRSIRPTERLCANSPYLGLLGLEGASSPDSPEKSSSPVFE